MRCRGVFARSRCVLAPDPRTQAKAFSQPSHCDAANQFLVSVQSSGIVAKPFTVGLVRKAGGRISLSGLA